MFTLGRSTYEQDAWKIRPLLNYGTAAGGAAVTFVPALVGVHGTAFTPAVAGGPEYNVQGRDDGVDVRGTGDGGKAHGAFAVPDGTTSITVTPLLVIEDTIAKYATMSNYVIGIDPATASDGDYGDVEGTAIYKVVGDFVKGTGLSVTVSVNYTNEIFRLVTVCGTPLTASVVRVVGWLIS